MLRTLLPQQRLFYQVSCHGHSERPPLPHTNMNGTHTGMKRGLFKFYARPVVYEMPASEIFAAENGGVGVAVV